MLLWMLTTFVRPTRASLETQPCDNDKITTKDKACVEISGRTSYNSPRNESFRSGTKYYIVRSMKIDQGGTMLYLLSKYDAFVFGSKKKLYQKRAVKIKALSI